MTPLYAHMPLPVLRSSTVKSGARVRRFRGVNNLMALESDEDSQIRGPGSSPGTVRCKISLFVVTESPQSSVIGRSSSLRATSHPRSIRTARPDVRSSCFSNCTRTARRKGFWSSRRAEQADGGVRRRPRLCCRCEGFRSERRVRSGV